MKIIVCIKQVPDTTEVRINPETGTLIRDGVKSIMNPDDKSALELALRLKDKDDSIKVIALTMGPTQAKEILVEARCMGADKGYLLTDRLFQGSDTWATSYTLSQTIKKLNYDIVFCGRQAIDGDTAQVGPQIAEHLKIPHASYVSEAELENDHLIVKRNFSNGYQILKMPKNSLITVINEKVKPRYMNTSYIVDVYNEENIETLKAEDIELDKSQLGLKGSPTKVNKSMTKKPKANGLIIKDNIDEKAKEIAKILLKV